MCWLLWATRGKASIHSSRGTLGDSDSEAEAARNWVIEEVEVGAKSEGYFCRRR